MILEIPRKSFLSALTMIKPASYSRVNPILLCAHVCTHLDYVDITATDLKTTVRATVEGVSGGEERSEFLMPLATTLRLVSSFDGDTVIIEPAEDCVRITSGAAKTKLLTLPATEFVAARNVTGSTIEIPASQLLRAMNNVSFAICAEETRTALCGMRFEGSTEALTLIATDGKRMAIDRIAPGPLCGFTMPIKAVKAVAACLAACKNDETVAVTIGSQSVEFEIGLVCVQSQYIDGTFPNFRAVIPNYARSYSSSTFEISHLADVVDRAWMLCDERDRKMSLSFDDAGLLVTSHGPDGEFTELVAHDTATEEKWSVDLNPDFLLDVLRRIDTGMVQIWVGDSEHPVYVTNGKDHDFQNVIMPIRQGNASKEEK